MTSAPIEAKRKEVGVALLKDMETTAVRIRDLIVAMPAKDLLGYIYAQWTMKVMRDQGAASNDRDADGPDDVITESQFLLEYIHAVLASNAAPADVKFDEQKCATLWKLSFTAMCSRRTKRS